MKYRYTDLKGNLHVLEGTEEFVNETFQQSCYKLFVWSEFNYRYFDEKPKRKDKIYKT